MVAGPRKTAFDCIVVVGVLVAASVFASYNEAIRIDPNCAICYYNRGNAYQAKDDKDRAIRDYDEAIRIDPNYAHAYYNRGLAKQAKGDAAGGDADIAKAKQLNPNVGN
jgi:tetratricopeptide (TPR) repeat protein